MVMEKGINDILTNATATRRFVTHLKRQLVIKHVDSGK